MYLIKSGDTAVSDNYRPIMITCTLEKLYSAHLDGRLSAFAESASNSTDYQRGARPTRNTSDNVFILR